MSTRVAQVWLTTQYYLSAAETLPADSRVRDTSISGETAVADLVEELGYTSSQLRLVACLSSGWRICGR